MTKGKNSQSNVGEPDLSASETQTWSFGTQPKVGPSYLKLSILSRPRWDLRFTMRWWKSGIGFWSGRQCVKTTPTPPTHEKSVGTSCDPRLTWWIRKEWSWQPWPRLDFQVLHFQLLNQSHRRCNSHLHTRFFSIAMVSPSSIWVLKVSQLSSVPLLGFCNLHISGLSWIVNPHPSIFGLWWKMNGSIAILRGAEGSWKVSWVDIFQWQVEF